jgi:hypothetical protein
MIEVKEEDMFCQYRSHRVLLDCVVMLMDLYHVIWSMNTLLNIYTYVSCFPTVLYLVICGNIWIL